MPGPFELLVIAAIVLVPLVGIGVVLAVVWWLLRKGRRRAATDRSSDAARQSVEATILDD